VRDIKQQPNPASEVVDKFGRMSVEWTKWIDEFVKAVQSRVPVTGTMTFAAATATITLSTPEANTDYDIFYAGPENRAAWTTSKTTTTFQANLSSASTATWSWALIRR
jgi:muramidase (phage lysozyme)